ncbi:putative aldouronate transport system permease protein [Paenibacillus rhizosphaerae]|uniref:Putative aldouronate transport system permease protein n=1 Tax=Paenibacillus rhizosphaerae TaxID=297318 RepID=A0A839TFY2_9BACL|nr:ABC transporter permease subunit [Paenibacillus rhizosphaerae]MBB3125403.1 putative aldouronate transport system permease protein [Paenibacillus rhizosphaerae]
MRLRKNAVLYWMLLPGMILVFVFHYLPMAGLVMAFQDFKPWLGFVKSPWVGWENFQMAFQREDSLQVVWNTFFIACTKIIVNLVVPVVFALLLNEIRHMGLKKVIQTLVYLPHFLSWVVFGGIVGDILSSQGIINTLVLPSLGLDPILFLADGNWFRFVVIVSDNWKEFGFATIVFLAALSNIDPSLYEAAEVDGANRWRQTWAVTLPALVPIVIVVGTLAMSSVLNAGFDQIFNLYNPLVYDKGDIIDTFVYRVGLLNSEFGLGTAIGLFKSAVGFIMVIIAYVLASRFANYRIF